MDSEVRERRMLEWEMAEALENGEFQLFYQPVVDAGTFAVSGYEALIRWNHPIRGLFRRRSSFPSRSNRA